VKRSLGIKSVILVFHAPLECRRASLNRPARSGHSHSLLRHNILAAIWSFQIPYKAPLLPSFSQPERRPTKTTTKKYQSFTGQSQRFSHNPNHIPNITETHNCNLAARISHTHLHHLHYPHGHPPCTTSQTATTVPSASRPLAQHAISASPIGPSRSRCIRTNTP
jgi:hypothetical protein